MKIIILAFVIIVILIGSYFLYPFPNENEDIPDDWRVDIKNGNARVSVVYISYNVLHDSGMISELKKQMEWKPTGYHSVKSFYAKYGISLTFSYREFSISSLYKPCEDGQIINHVILLSLAEQKPVEFDSLYNAGDILVFVVQAHIQGASSGGSYVFVQAFRGSSSGFFTQTGWFSGVVAHEIAHCFGARDHYAATGGIGLGCKDCLMNHMENDEGRLTEGTVFCPVALSGIEEELHFDWVCKASRESFTKEYWEGRLTGTSIPSGGVLLLAIIPIVTTTLYMKYKKYKRQRMRGKRI